MGPMVLMVLVLTVSLHSGPAGAATSQVGAAASQATPSSPQPSWVKSQAEQEALSKKRAQALENMEKNKKASGPSKPSQKMPSVETKEDWLHHIALDENNKFISRAIAVKGRNILSHDENEPVFVFSPEGSGNLYALGYSDQLDDQVSHLKIGQEITAYVVLAEKALEESEVIAIDRVPDYFYAHPGVEKILVSTVVKINGRNVFSKSDKENIFMTKPEGQDTLIPLGYAGALDDIVEKLEAGKEITAYVAVDDNNPEESEIISIHEKPKHYLSFSEFKALNPGIKYDATLSSLIRVLTPLKAKAPKKSLEEVLSNLQTQLRVMEGRILNAIKQPREKNQD